MPQKYNNKTLYNIITYTYIALLLLPIIIITLIKASKTGETSIEDNNSSQEVVINLTETSYTTETTTTQLISDVNEQTHITKTEVTTEEETISTMITDDTLINNTYILPVDVIYQYPELPTGCEITSLAVVLNYLNFPTNKLDLTDNYLIKDNYGVSDFNNAFIGDPRSSSGHGCYAPVIQKSATLYFEQNGYSNKAIDLTGTDLTDLYKYVENGFPVITWTTSGLVEPYQTYVWTLPSGEDVYWMTNEHCVVLIGYNIDDNTVTVVDPQKGVINYDTKLFNQRYEELNKQAIIIN